MRVRVRVGVDGTGASGLSAISTSSNGKVASALRQGMYPRSPLGGSESESESELESELGGSW